MLMMLGRGPSVYAAAVRSVSQFTELWISSAGTTSIETFALKSEFITVCYRINGSLCRSSNTKTNSGKRDILQQRSSFAAVGCKRSYMPVYTVLQIVIH